MSQQGILTRGKKNYELGRDLDNSETIAYAATIKEAPKEETKSKKGK